jgi:hypothetical protein
MICNGHISHVTAARIATIAGFPIGLSQEKSKEDEISYK